MQGNSDEDPPETIEIPAVSCPDGREPMAHLLPGTERLGALQNAEPCHSEPATGEARLSQIKDKETIERVFADAKEKHAMRYTHHRGLGRVKSWVRHKYAAMNLKQLAEWSWNNSFFVSFLSFFPCLCRNPHFRLTKAGTSLTR